jgi:crossover junction endodeoxyribonuclease RuvC
MRILGIDPGMTGGCAIYDPHNGFIVDAVDIPTIGEKAKERIDVRHLSAWMINNGAKHAFVERAQAMPGQGSSSGFKYGRGVGYLEATAVLSGIPLTIIEVRAWKKYFGITGTKADGAGEAARALAIQQFPAASHLFARKKDHGRAEAALIAVYGASLAR